MADGLHSEEHENLVNGVLPTGLTPEEDLKCLRAFQAFDRDGSGYIDTEEMGAVLAMMGQTFSNEEIHRMLA